MLNITDDNYDYYKKVFEILWMFIAKANKLDPKGEASPLTLLANWENKSKSLARRSLKLGLIDVITTSMDMSFDKRKDINDQLINHGFSGFNQLVSTVKDTLEKVLKRGKVKNFDEYYLLKELLDDSKSGISETDKRQIEGILGNFEINYRKKNNG